MKVAHLSEPAEERVIFRDGLGVREWRDTGTGERVEWLHLDAAFAGVELPLRDRVTRLAKLQHVKFARILNLEPAREGKGPVLVSSHVAGTRLSEVLEMAGHGLVTFDPGSGLQVTRDVLAALAILHDSRNVTHGALGPERVVLTASGRVVMVEHVLAQALDRLKLPRHQLWRDWRIATPPAAGQVRFDIKTDIAQAGLLALAALLGRPLEAEEYPHRLRGLLPIVQDRLGKSPAAAIAGDVVAWLERLVPVDSRRPFGTVRQAQQAFEALVSGGAAAMGISLTRVKGVMGAVAAIGVSPEPAAPVTEASPAAPAVAPGPVAEMAAVPNVLPSVAVDVSPRADDAADSASAGTDESAIDIEALLALEAELEGGDRGLQGLAQERTNLERQFASLVETVAPAPSEPPVRLIPETPASSEPLVDERVRWSSMPAETDDLPAPDAAPADFAPAAMADDPRHPFVDADAAAADPMATDGGTEAFAFEPIVISVPEEPTPAAAIDHVPADWWREALPWRAGGGEARADAAVGIAEAVTGASDIAQDDAETLAEVSSADAPEPAADAASALDDADADGTAGHEHEQRGDDSSDARDGTGWEPRLVTDTDADAVAWDVVVAPVAGQLAADDAEPLPSLPEPARTAFDVRFGSLTLESLELRASTIALVPTTEPAVVGEPDGVPATLDVEVAADREAEVVEHTTANEFNEPDTPIALAPVEAEAPSEPVAAAEDVAPGDRAESVEHVARVEPTDAAEADAPVELLQAGTEGPPVASLFDEAAASMESVAADGPIDSIETGDAVAANDAVPGFEPGVHTGATGASVVASDEAEGLDAVADASLEPLVAEVTGEAWDDDIDDGVTRVGGDTADVVQSIVDAIPAAEPEQGADPAGDIAASDPEPAVVVGVDAAEAAGLVTLSEDDTSGDAVVESGAPLADSPHDDISVAAAGEAPTSAFTEPQPRLDAEEAQDTSPAGADVATPPTSAASLLARLVQADEHTHRTSWRDALLADTADAAPPTSPAPAFFAEPVSDPAAPGALVAAAPSVPEERPVALEPVPEVVIVDGGSDASAWDHLPSEQPEASQDAPATHESLAAADKPGAVDEDGVEPHDEDGQEAPASAANSGDAGAAPGRRKRRRNRRRKGGAAQPPVAPEIAVPQVPVPMMVPVSQIPGMPGMIAYAPIPASMGSVPVIAPAIAASMPLLGHQAGTSAIATVEARPAIEAPAPARQDIDDAGEQGGAAPARTRTLLDREVPTWTPPADLRAVRQRALPMVSRESAAPLERAAAAERDEQGGGVHPSPDGASELPTTPAIPADAGVRSPGAAGRGIAQALPPPVEPVLQFEQEIRAVGMPDLDEMAPRTARAALTSMADAIGPVSPAPRQSKGDHWAAQPASREPARGMNWRRLIAASVIVALFQGAAFAAWWWVQPGAYGTLVVQTAQPGVEVLIDGKVIGRTPLREEVVPGRHALTLRQGGNVRRMPVEISLGVVTTQALDWPAVDGVAMGNLQVTSTPTGAEVFIDGTSRGKAPVLLEELRAGKHELTLRSDAGTVTVETTVLAGETTSLEVPIFAGWILVDSPLEVSLVLGRKKIGSSMDGQILMPPGTHRVQAVNEALGIRQSFTVRVEPGAVERVAIAVPASPLQLQDEAGTEVFVDGERIGTLPGALSIPVGTHDVRVRRPDGSERRQTVTVRQGEVVSM